MTPEEREKHIENILNILESEKIFTFKDIFVFYKGCSRATAYNYHLDEIDAIKEAITSNKRRGVQSLVDKWIDSENATLQIAAFKIIAEPEERKAISQNYTDVTSDNKPIQTVDPFAQMRLNNGINTEAKESD